MTTARERTDALTRSIGDGLHQHVAETPAELVILFGTHARTVEDDPAPPSRKPGRIRKWLNRNRLRGR
jgi:hypothetical protein